MQSVGLERLLITSPVTFGETAIPTRVRQDQAKIYAKDKAGVSQLYWMDDDTVEHEFADSADLPHAMLDGSVHTDSVADAVSRGSIIIGNSTPKWDELVVGTTGQYLGTDGTDILWRAQSTLDHGSIGGLTDNDHAQYLLVADIDDTPVNGETAQPISSNWAFDHVAAADPHTGYVLESVLTTNGDLFIRAAGAIARLGIGTDDQVLTVVSGAPAWADAAGGGSLELPAELDVTGLDPTDTYGLLFSGEWEADEDDSAILTVAATLEGDGNIVRGISSEPIFSPSANITHAIAGYFVAEANPPADVTITNLFGIHAANIYEGDDGAVTNACAWIARSPIAGGTLKPSNQYGAYVEDQGLTGIAQAVALGLELPTNATANYYLEVDNVGDTTAGSMQYFARLPVKTPSGTKYVHLYNGGGFSGGVAGGSGGSGGESFHPFLLSLN